MFGFSWFARLSRACFGREDGLAMRLLQRSRPAQTSTLSASLGERQEHGVQAGGVDGGHSRVGLSRRLSYVDPAALRPSTREAGGVSQARRSFPRLRGRVKDLLAAPRAASGVSPQRGAPGPSRAGHTRRGPAHHQGPDQAVVGKSNHSETGEPSPEPTSEVREATSPG